MVTDGRHDAQCPVCSWNTTLHYSLLPVPVSPVGTKSYTLAMDATDMNLFRGHIAAHGGSPGGGSLMAA